MVSALRCPSGSDSMASRTVARIVRRVRQTLDKRGQKVPVLARVTTSTFAARSRPLAAAQRVEGYVASDPDDPRADGLALAQALGALDGPLQGLICTVLDVRVARRLPHDVGDDRPHERPERGRFPRKSVFFSLF
jgi:hypothetical protein